MPGYNEDDEAEDLRGICRFLGAKFKEGENAWTAEANMR